MDAPKSSIRMQLSSLSRIPSGFVKLVALSLALIVLLGLVADLGTSSPAPARSDSQASYNNFENLISDFLDDAGDRLKKSKMNGLRQVKQTLRFGRRSDPWFQPGMPEPLTLEELQNNQHLYGLA